MADLIYGKTDWRLDGNKTTIGGNPAVEKWSKSDQRGELNILVGKRFMITVEGSDLSSIQDVHAFASAMDFGAIAALK